MRRRHAGEPKLAGRSGFPLRPGLEGGIARHRRSSSDCTSARDVRPGKGPLVSGGGHRSVVVERVLDVAEREPRGDVRINKDLVDVVPVPVSSLINLIGDHHHRREQICLVRIH